MLTEENKITVVEKRIKNFIEIVFLTSMNILNHP